MKRFTLIAAVIALSTTSIMAATPKPDIARGKEIAETVCVACHAADGNSVISIYPKIAGQHAGYAYAQAMAIKNMTRTTGLSATMVPMVAEMTDQDMQNVVAFFATQHVKQGQADPKPEELKLGAQIYRGGNPATKVPACMACHGPSGSGIPEIYPRLSSQHADYTVTQLKAFRDGTRKHDMMDPIATRLTDDQITAVANFIQGLK